MVGQTVYPRSAEIIRTVMRDHLSVLEMVDKMPTSCVMAGVQIIADPEQNTIMLVCWNEDKTVGMMCRTTPRIVRDLYREADNTMKVMRTARRAGLISPPDKGASRWGV